MDPVSLVLAALAAGAAAGVTDTVKTAFGDAYKGLKSLVVNAFQGDKTAESALTLFEKRPTEPAFVETLTDYVITHRVEQDDAVAAAAQRVLELAGPQAQAEGSVVATVLQIHADRGANAAAVNNGVMTGGYNAAPGEEPTPS